MAKFAYEFKVHFDTISDVLYFERVRKLAPNSENEDALGAAFSSQPPKHHL